MGRGWMNGARVLAAMILPLALSVVALAQDFPSKPIHIVVPLTPGAAADTLPRMVGARLAEYWGQPVIIDSRPGAAQNLGATLVARAAPDGYTLLAAPPPPLAINQHLYAKLDYDPAAFVPVSVMATLPNVLVSAPSYPVKTLGEFIARAKADPGKTSYASAGIGATAQLAMEWLAQLTGARLTHVPYNGNAPALLDVMAGRVDVMFDNAGNVLPNLKDGRLKALAVTTATRMEELPDVPTVAETWPEFVMTTWFAIAAPPGTPPAIVEKLSAGVARAMAESEIAAYLRSISARAAAASPAETGAFIRKDADNWGRTIRAAGIKGE